MAPNDEREGAFSQRYGAIGELNDLRGLYPEDATLDLEELAAKRDRLAKELDELVQRPGFHPELRKKIDEATDEQHERIQAVLQPLGWVGRESDRRLRELAQDEARAATERSDALAARVEELEGQVSELTDLRQRKEELEARVEELEDGQVSMTARVHELSREVQRQAGEIAGLKERNGELEAQVERPGEPLQESWTEREA